MGRGINSKIGKEKTNKNSFINKLNSTLAMADSPDKSIRIQARRDFAKWLDSNASAQETSVSTGEHSISITQDNAWYVNNAGTVFLLGADAYWHRLGNNLTLYRDRKISVSERERIKNLLARK